MKKYSIRMMALLTAMLLLLSACAEKESVPADLSGESRVWDNMPQLQAGELAYDTLKILPWNDGRAEATSHNRWAETEKGYYVVMAGMLYYADKVNLSLWVPVCGQPECKHQSSTVCDAIISSNSILIRNSRLYFDTGSYNFPSLVPKEHMGPGIFNKAPNGSDTKLAFLTEYDGNASLRRTSSILTSQYWLYSAVYLNPDGSETGKLFLITDSGVQCIGQRDGENLSSWLQHTAWHGDIAFGCSFLGDNPAAVYRIVENAPVELNAAKYIDTPGYLSGDILRIFRPNEGYYDVQLDTGTELPVADNQLPNSIASMPLPNCIIETTIGSSQHPVGTTHAMVLYDGSSWRDVQLPSELLHATYSDFNPELYRGLETACVASDRVFFTHSNGNLTWDLYCIDLTGEDLVMEYCGLLGYVEEEP